MTDSETLAEILKWLKVGFYSAAKQSLEDVLDTDNKRRAYQLTDGSLAQDRVRSQAQIGSNVLSALYKQCLSVGLMERSTTGRNRRLFDLADFGLLPEVADVQEHEHE